MKHASEKIEFYFFFFLKVVRFNFIFTLITFLVDLIYAIAFVFHFNSNLKRTHTFAPSIFSFLHASNSLLSDFKNSHSKKIIGKNKFFVYFSRNCSHASLAHAYYNCPDVCHTEKKTESNLSHMTS